MTHFQSPAFHESTGRVPAAVMRGLLGVAALGFTAGLWVAVGAQAGHFGEQDTAQHIALPPVVIAGRRLPPEGVTAALGAGPSGVDCTKDAFSRESGSPIRVNLKQ